MAPGADSPDQIADRSLRNQPPSKSHLARESHSLAKSVIAFDKVHTRSDTMKISTHNDVKNVPLDTIEFTVGIQTRRQLDDETIEDYSQAMRGGTEFPPVVLFQTEPTAGWILADGFHRVAAARKAGLRRILAEVRQGDRQAATTYALRANVKHGRRRTNADKRKTVEIALKEFPDQSDRSLAEMCAVDKSLVASIRRQVADSTTCASHKRIGMDGKAYRSPGRRGLDKPVADPVSRHTQIGVSVPQEQANVKVPSQPKPTLGAQDLPRALPAVLFERFPDLEPSVEGWEAYIRARIGEAPDLKPAFRAGLVALLTWFDALPEPNTTTTDCVTIKSNATDHPTPHPTIA